MEQKELLKLEQIYKMLGSAVRLKILLSLEAGERSAGQLAEVCGLSQSAASHQLKDLRQYKIIKSRKEGMNVFYSLQDRHILEMLLVGVEHINEINCDG